jgi:hypothetical protein
VSEASFTADLDNLALDELRERRRVCDDLNSELSYYRRLLHGRLDLLGFELRRRSGEETRSLIEALPEILADSGEPHRESMPKNLPIELPDMGERRRAIDRALDDDFLAHLHDALTAILEELTRRYRDGSATVDELLRQP